MAKASDSNGWFAGAVPLPSTSSEVGSMVNDNTIYRPTDSASDPIFKNLGDNNQSGWSPVYSVFPSISALTTPVGLCSIFACCVLIFISGLYLLHMIAIFYG
jgi:hypothetical protein